MAEHAATGASVLPVLTFLAAAVIAVPLFRFLGLGAVIGYLAAGFAIGPAGLALIRDGAAVMHIAEFGVVLLLFIIGLELKPAKLLSMRRDILGLGSLQMAVTAAALALGVAFLVNANWRGALLAGLALAFSSTAIAMQLLEERGAVNSDYGRRSFAVLLMQDVLVAPVLALAPLIAGAGASASSWRDGLLAFAVVLAAVAFVIGAGRYVLNPVFAILARAGAREVMAAAALLVVLGAALLMQSAGLSMALGAFLAGLLLSESSFRHQLEADIEPFRGLLMGLFFMSVGMAIDGKVVAAQWQGLLAAALALVALKGVIVFALMRMSGSRLCDAISGASVLTTAGEFAFVVFPVAFAAGLLNAQQTALLMAVTAITMIFGPLTAKLLDRLAARCAPAGESQDAESVPDHARGNVLVIGFGRFGQLAVQVMLAARMNVTVIDNDVARIRNAARFGFKVYYGNGTRLDVLRAAGAGEAQLIAVCVNGKEDATHILELVKSQFPGARVHVRAFDRVHALELFERNADHFERETFESAIRFGASVTSALTGDPELAESVAADVRQRDIERLKLQQDGLLYSEVSPWTSIEPEPLTPVSRPARPLNRETAVIVEERTQPVPAGANPGANSGAGQ